MSIPIFVNISECLRSHLESSQTPKWKGQTGKSYEAKSGKIFFALKEILRNSKFTINVQGGDIPMPSPPVKLAYLTLLMTLFHPRMTYRQPKFILSAGILLWSTTRYTLTLHYLWDFNFFSMARVKIPYLLSLKKKRGTWYPLFIRYGIDQIFFRLLPLTLLSWRNYKMVRT